MIGEALRLLRIFNDVKLVELAKALDVSPSYISEVENGKRRPNLDLIEKYATYFHVRPSSILFFAEEMDRTTLSGKVKSTVREKMIQFMKMLEKSEGRKFERENQEPP